MSRLVFAGLLSLAAAVCFCAEARADGSAFYGFPWFGYGNNGPAAYALGNIPAPPYFALHPPVYYSHPIARPYGYSTFACPCDCNHGRRQAVHRVLVNPYVAQKSNEVPSKKAEAKVAVTPVRISNPFFDGGNRETALAGLK